MFKCVQRTIIKKNYAATKVAPLTLSYLNKSAEKKEETEHQNETKRLNAIVN